VGFADRLLLTKIDLVAEIEVRQVVKRLRKINVRAPIVSSPMEASEVAKLLELNAFHLNDVLELDPGFLIGHHPQGERRGGGEEASAEKTWDDDISSMVLRHQGRVDLDRIGGFVEELLATYGNDMLRYKGILAIEGKSERLVFQGVHRITGFDYGRPWELGEEAESVIVIIGRRLDKASIYCRFNTAVSTP